MIPELRKTKQKLSESEICEVLKRAFFGTLALNGEYPYAVPVNYVYYNHCIYFHSSRGGEKLRRIEKDPRVSFCAVEAAAPLPERYSASYRSVICYGEAELVREEEEKKEAFRQIVRKYAAEYQEKLEMCIERSGKNAEIVRIRIETATGKFNAD